MMDIESYRQAFEDIRKESDDSEVRGLVLRAVRTMPKSPEFVGLFKLGLSLLSRVHDPQDRNLAILDYVKEVPLTDSFRRFYMTAIEDAITAADALDEAHRRLTELLRLLGEMPKTKEFRNLRHLAWRLALNLPDKPRFQGMPIEKVANELPKASDDDFYRRYTLLGVAKEVLKDGSFPELYREAMQHAMKAALTIPEPYYKKFAFLFIANELSKTPDHMDLYAAALTDAFKAACELSDPFAREYGLLEVLKDVPKTEEFYHLLREILEQTLSFFTIKNWMGDLEVFDVVDYILSAEETGVTDSKKKRFTRERYSKLISIELEKFGPMLNDIRFIETLKPYTHVWVQPKNLRDAIKKVVNHLEGLKDVFHGKEIKRPVFVSESYPGGLGSYIHKKEADTNECIAIDLGATNTVIMRKKGTGPADYVVLAPISAQYDGVQVIPTVLGAGTDTIGADVHDESPISDIKQLLLDGNPKGRAYMERFFRVLYQHLKKAVSTGGWFVFASREADVVYLTAPVGYQDYRGVLKEIAGSVIRGVKVEILEEPLAAAIGYQVAEEKDKVMMIIDFGGSTLNTMVVRLNINEVHVVAKPERAQLLGGHDIDRWLAEYLAEKIGMSPESVTYSLVRAAEDIKIRLSKRDHVPFEWDGREVCAITRSEFEAVLDKHEFYDLVDRTLTYVIKRAEKVGIRKEKIEAVLLTGGSSQIPSFNEKIGDFFESLRGRNLIYDHSPLSAVATGAALYGTRDVMDRHLGIAYALKYSTENGAKHHSYSIILEKGEILPLEKTYRITPARRLATQKEILLELYEVPESLITRKWVMEGGIEFIKQEIIASDEVELADFKTITLQFKEPVDSPIDVTFSIDEKGSLKVRYGIETVDTGLRLQ